MEISERDRACLPSISLNFALTMMNFALKMMNFALTMMTVDYHPVKKEDLEEIEEVVRSVEARPGGYLMPDE